MPFLAVRPAIVPRAGKARGVSGGRASARAGSPPAQAADGLLITAGSDKIIDLHTNLNTAMNNTGWMELEGVPILARRVATGNDSHVFRYGDVVLKEYQTASLDAVSRYVGLLQRCVDLIETLNYRFSVTWSGDSYDVLFVGIPVDRVVHNAGGRPITVSQFVAEPNFDKLTAPAEIFARYEPVDPDPGNRAFFAALNQYFNQEQPTRLRDEFDFHISMLSRLLDFHLGTFGLYIGKYNVKMRPDRTRKLLTLIVTDVAVYLPRVVAAEDYGSAVRMAMQRFAAGTQPPPS